MNKAYVDGGCRPNPGLGAYGFLIFDEKDRELKRGNGHVGEYVTNNIAEYTAIIEALKAANALGLKKLAVFSSSEFVVKQLNGDNGVRNPALKQLHNKIIALADNMEKIIFVFIKGSSNRLADELTNKYYEFYNKVSGQ